MGAALRRARRTAGLSLRDVQALSEGAFKASAVGAYERGERPITVVRFHALARLYGRAPDALLGEALRDPGPAITIDRERLGLVQARVRGLIVRHMEIVEEQRALRLDVRVSLRAGDVESIAAAGEMTAGEVLAALAPALEG